MKTKLRRSYETPAVPLCVLVIGLHFYAILAVLSAARFSGWNEVEENFWKIDSSHQRTNARKTAMNCKKQRMFMKKSLMQGHVTLTSLM